MNLTEPSTEEERGWALSERQLYTVRSVVYLVLLSVVVVFGMIKLWQSQLPTQDLKFNDFVVAGLAMFSIWLSVSFLDRATQQSNRFYNSAYTTLREMSASLSRLHDENEERDTELERLRQEVKAIAHRDALEGRVITTR